MSKYVQRYKRNELGRDLIVGDIHGCFTKLKADLDRLGFNPDIDRLFSVGDLVDRGQESMLALDWVGLPWFHAVSGNHESMAVDWAAGDMPAGHYASNGGAWNIANDDVTRKSIAHAFVDLPIAIELETNSGVVGIVHADCPAPSWGQFIKSLESTIISDDERSHLISMAQWSRNRIQKRINTPIHDVRAVVVGHTPLNSMAVLGNVIFIDTGGWCGYDFCIIDAESLLPAAKTEVAK